MRCILEKTLILNWKHHWVDDWLQYIPLMQQYPHIALIPPIPLLGAFHSYVSSQQLVAPYISLEETGPFTGACGPQYLKKMGINRILLGHSEQRKANNRAPLSMQFEKAREHEMSILFCIGESDPLALKTELMAQLRMLEKNLEHITLAYEPTWAIGTGSACSQEHLNRVIDFLKEYFQTEDLSLYYGGSLNLENFPYYWNHPLLKGFLIGKMSLELEKIQGVLHYIQKQDSCFEKI